MPGEGDRFVNYPPFAGKGACDEIVSFKPGAENGDKTLVSAHSGYGVTLEGVVGVKEQQLVKKEAELQRTVDFCRTTLADMGKEREALEARLQELTTQAGDGEKPSEALQKVQTDLTELEKQEKEFSTGLKTAETNLEEVQQALRKERVDSFRNGEVNMRREQEARAAIEFVDGLHLGEVLGADNVDTFFKAINEKMGWKGGQAIDPARQEITKEQKQVVMRVLAGMLGLGAGNMAQFFETGAYRVKSDKTAEQVKNGLAHTGLYQSDHFPPVEMGRSPQVA